MARPKLRQAAQRGESTDPPLAQPVAFSLAVSGVVVHKDQLVAALKPFMPQLADIEAFEDGERFLFVFSPGPPEGSPAAIPSEP